MHAGVIFLQGEFSQTAGVTRLTGGNISPSPITFAGGRLEGSGAIGADVTSSATVAPGLSAGLLQLDPGAYTQTTAGTLELEIGGVALASFDRLTTTGAASLNGTLKVSLIGGFTPSPGDSFEVLTFQSRTGDFAQDEGLILGGGLGFRKVYTDSALVLQTVKENCNDLSDQDGDGLAGCDDPKCAGVGPCVGTVTATPLTATPTATQTATPPPTASATAVFTATAPPTFTPTIAATATASPQAPTPTPTPTRTPSCTGDCGGDGTVSDEDIDLVLRTIFDAALVDLCPPLPANPSAADLVAAIRSRGQGCD